jgi:MFS family permease
MKALFPARTTSAEDDGRSGTPVVAGLSLAILMASLGGGVANVALPVLAGAFEAPFQSVQWVVIAYLLAMTTAVVGAGRLGDILGHRRLLLGGIALFATASLICSLSPWLSLLIAARGVQGVGAAIMTALSMALVGEAVPPERTGRAMGMIGTMSAVGTALGPSLGGLLIAGFGWQSLFLVLAALGAATWLVVRHVLPERRQVRKAGVRDLDATGLAVLAAGLAAYALAMTMGRSGWGSVNMVLLATAAALAVLFVRKERRARMPAVRLSLVGEPAMARQLAATGIVATVVMATMVVGPFYLSQALGLDAAPVGIVLSAGPVVAAITGRRASWWTDWARGSRRSSAWSCWRRAARRWRRRSLSGVSQVSWFRSPS